LAAVFFAAVVFLAVVFFAGAFFAGVSLTAHSSPRGRPDPRAPAPRCHPLVTR
jgi:hypothetical protein